MKKLIGIYRIKNLINNKVYIGSSVNIKQRFREHKRALLNGVHHSRHLQKSWDKYKESSFEWNILEFITDVSILRKREKELILEYKANDGDFGYNSSLPDENSLGTSGHSDETKELLRRLYYKSRFGTFVEEEYQEWINKAAHKIKKTKEEKELWHKEHKYSVIVLNLNNKIVGTYDCLLTACKELNVNVKKANDFMVKRVINKGKNVSIRKSVKGYIFIKESEYDPNKDYTYKQERTHTIVCTKEDFTKEYNSPQEAADELGMKVGRVYEVLRGHSKTCGVGYSFKYKEEFAKKFKEVF